MNDSTNRSILVWDLPVRLFHWLLALSFFGAYVTAESERWRLMHITLGYTMAGLVVFRLLWGVIGTRHARFTSFVRGPRAVVRYLGAIFRGRPEHHVGHNPAGALAAVAMMVMTVVVAASGWATYNDVGGKWFEELHEGAASVMLGIVGIHVVGVLLSSWLHRENLVGAMFTGRKQGHPQDGIRRAWRPVGVLVLSAVLGYWWLQWHSAPSSGELTGRPAATASYKDKHRDHADPPR